MHETKRYNMKEVINNLSNYLYVLIKFGVRIPFKDVKELRHYFEPTEEGEFSPTRYLQ